MSSNSVCKFIPVIKTSRTPATRSSDFVNHSNDNKVLLPLSSTVDSLCCAGEAGEKEKESARSTMVIVPECFLFSIIAIFIWIHSGSLCGGDRPYYHYLSINV